MDNVYYSKRVKIASAGVHPTPKNNLSREQPLYSKNPKRIALLTSLVTGVILVILGLALVGLYFSDFAAYRHQQRSVQAYWNARSGAERYALERTVPPNGLIKLAAGECHIEKLASGDIRCTGQFEGVKREIVVIGGRINHRTELP